MNINQDNARKLLIQQCKQGDTTNLKQLALLAHDPALNQKALRYAIKAGHTHIVRELVSFYNPKHDNDIVLRTAITLNRTDIVNILSQHTPL